MLLLENKYDDDDDDINKETNIRNNLDQLGRYLFSN